MFRRSENLTETSPLDYPRDDFEDLVAPMVGGVIVLAIVFVILPAVVSLFLR